MFLAAAVTTAAIVWLLVTSHHIRVHQSLSSLRRCHSNLRSAIGPPTVSLSLTSALKLHCHGILVVVRHVRPQGHKITIAALPALNPVACLAHEDGTKLSQRAIPKQCGCEHRVGRAQEGTRSGGMAYAPARTM